MANLVRDAPLFRATHVFDGTTMARGWSESLQTLAKAGIYRAPTFRVSSRALFRMRRGTMLKQMILWCVLVSCALTRGASAAELPTMPLTINGHKLVAEIAANTQTRATGLMHRFSLKPDHGMLFVFRDQRPLSFWMKNTFVALSIAYIDSRGKIIEIEDMAPQTETMHPSSAPAQYALEMKKGWFKERGIGAGAVVTGLDKAPRAED